MPPQEFWQGVEEFNRQDFYACHDTLEALWMEAPQVDKRFYQGILQIAVGCYHLDNLNWRGAAISLGEGCMRLQDYEPEYGGIDVAQLLEESLNLLDALHDVGAAGVADLLERIQQGEGEEKLPTIQLVASY